MNINSKAIRELDKRIMVGRRIILQKALDLKILTKKEYEEEYKSKYIDHYGIDSFFNYLVACIHKIDRFITICKPMIKDRDKLEKRFKVKIKTPEEILIEKNICPKCGSKNFKAKKSNERSCKCGYIRYPKDEKTS